MFLSQRGLETNTGVRMAQNQCPLPPLERQVEAQPESPKALLLSSLGSSSLAPSPEGHLLELRWGSAEVGPWAASGVW